MLLWPSTPKHDARFVSTCHCSCLRPSQTTQEVYRYHIILSIRNLKHWNTVRQTQGDSVMGVMLHSRTHMLYESTASLHALRHTARSRNIPSKSQRNHVSSSTRGFFLPASPRVLALTIFCTDEIWPELGTPCVDEGCFCTSSLAFALSSSSPANLSTMVPSRLNVSVHMHICSVGLCMYAIYSCVRAYLV